MKKFTLKKKSTAAPVATVAAEPTLAERIVAANAAAHSYLGMFESAVNGLEASATQLDKAHREARDEAEVLNAIAADARLNAAKRREQAENIRALIAGAAGE